MFISWCVLLCYTHFPNVSLYDYTCVVPHPAIVPLSPLELTYDVDEVTLCWRTATQGHPTAACCDIHHGQFPILYRRYIDASDIVDKMNRDRQLPTHEEIMGCMDWRTALEKGSLVRQYIDAIRIETEGRRLRVRS